MSKKLLSISGVQKLSKKQQSSVTGSFGGSSCRVDFPMGFTGQSCSTTSECIPNEDFPIFCWRGCCYSAY